jgi:hypothetical protein
MGRGVPIALPSTAGGVRLSGSACRAPGGRVIRRAKPASHEHAGRQARRRAPWLWRARPQSFTSAACRTRTGGSARAGPRPCALATDSGALASGRAPRSPAVFLEGGDALAAGSWRFRACGAGRPEDVAPVTRPAAMGSSEGAAVVAGRAPGPATFRSARLSVGGLAPPDNGAPRYRKSRALVLGHARARPCGAPPSRSAARPRGARSGQKVFCPPAPRAPACGSWRCRGPARLGRACPSGGHCGRRSASRAAASCPSSMPRRGRTAGHLWSGCAGQ